MIISKMGIRPEERKVRGKCEGETCMTGLSPRMTNVHLAGAQKGQTSHPPTPARQDAPCPKQGRSGLSIFKGGGMIPTRAFTRASEAARCASNGRSSRALPPLFQHPAILYPGSNCDIGLIPSPPALRHRFQKINIVLTSSYWGSGRGSEWGSDWTPYCIGVTRGPQGVFEYTTEFPFLWNIPTKGFSTKLLILVQFEGYTPLSVCRAPQAPSIFRF